MVFLFRISWLLSRFFWLIASSQVPGTIIYSQYNSITSWDIECFYVCVKGVPKWINGSMSFPTPLVNSKLSNLKALLLKNNQNSDLRLCLCNCQDLWNSLFQKAAENCELTLFGSVVEVEFDQEHNERQGLWMTGNIFKCRSEAGSDLVSMEKHSERHGAAVNEGDMIHKPCTFASGENQASNRLFIMKIP